MPAAYTGKTQADARKYVAALLPAPCYLCGQVVTRDMRWTVEHIIPRSAGGDHTPDNLAPAHAHCNYSAGAKLRHQRDRERNGRATRTTRRTAFWITSRG